MKKTILPLVAICTIACGGSNTNNTTSTNSIVDSLSTASTADESNAVEEIPGDVLSIFADFPNMATTAKSGEYILIPAYKMLQKYAEEQNSTVIYYNAKMATPAEINSKVAFTFDGEQEVPNHLIIPIAAGQKVAKGDIVLTWWQSGSGMQRALVTDATNPDAPEVHYLDIDWDNPAKNKAVSIGQLKETIKPNTFTKLTDLWQSGTTVAAMDGMSIKKFTIINVSNDKVLVKGFAGSMKMLDKSACTPLKVTNTVKVGDKIQAPWVGSFKNGTIKELKSDYGRAVIEFDDLKDKLYVVPLGDITTGLVL